MLYQRNVLVAIITALILIQQYSASVFFVFRHFFSRLFYHFATMAMIGQSVVPRLCPVKG